MKLFVETVPEATKTMRKKFFWIREQFISSKESLAGDFSLAPEVRFQNT